VAKFVFVYTGGEMAPTPEEQQKVMEAWMNWFGGLGDAVVDPGNPFGAACGVGTGGSVREVGASRLGGYSVISAGSLSEAADMAKGCPVLGAGGGVDVYEALPM